MFSVGYVYREVLGTGIIAHWASRQCCTMRPGGKRLDSNRLVKDMVITTITSSVIDIAFGL